MIFLTVRAIFVKKATTLLLIKARKNVLVRSINSNIDQVYKGTTQLEWDVED